MIDYIINFIMYTNYSFKKSKVILYKKYYKLEKK